MLDPNVRCVVEDSRPATPARHGPLGLHSGSRKTWGGWYRTTRVLRNALEQPPLWTDYLCVTPGWESSLVGGTMLLYDIFLSPLTEVFTSRLHLMWGKQFPAHRTGFQFNQLMERELFIPLPSTTSVFLQQHIHCGWVCTKCYNGLAIRATFIAC